MSLGEWKGVFDSQNPNVVTEGGANPFMKESKILRSWGQGDGLDHSRGLVAPFSRAPVNI